MKSEEIRRRFLNFFEKRRHAIIPSASLVTPDEKGVTNSTLFNTAGMQPLIPYLLGKPHPEGKRLVDVQKCVRTIDIDEVGDSVHATFFEMLGNWSLGDYFKKEAINWSYEFLTSKEEGLGLDPQRLYVTVFEGDSNAPKDSEAASIWSELFKKNGIEGERIFFMGAEKNWWEAGDSGPCGPDTEMYYDVKNKFGGKGITEKEFIKGDDERALVEVWNDVFMQYEKKEGKIVGNLPAPSVDTGAGLERLTMTVQGVESIFETDLFEPLIDVITGNVIASSSKSQRIIADHMRTAIFLISDGVLPANSDRGYILRRLLRRAVFNADRKSFSEGDVSVLVNSVIDKYQTVYENLHNSGTKIKQVISEELSKFEKALENGLREFKKIQGDNISGEDAFKLFASYGFPIDMTLDLAKEDGKSVDLARFNAKLKIHQELSRAGSEQKFKGGLGDTSDASLRYHTATHLLHKALRDVLGGSVRQKGSNITPERLRFDFSFDRKMTDVERKQVENIVNMKIQEGLPVNQVVLPRDEAEKTGALHFFGEKYGDTISIYYIGDSLDSAFSKEFCGGPHVKNTSDLKGHFKILKEEAVSQGVRRIKAVLE